jgi:hypothetical protein
MPSFPPRVGQRVKPTRDVILSGNAHVSVLSGAAPFVLSKGTLAEVVDVAAAHIDLNCRDGPSSAGIHAWGLKVRVAKVVWGTTFEDA